MEEIEEDQAIPFLDCWVSHDNNKLQTTVYRKLTHTDRLLDQSSYNPTSHKATTIKTLTRRAQLICDSPDALRQENDYLQRVFHKNNYNSDFIKLNTYKDNECNYSNNTLHIRYILDFHVSYDHRSSAQTDHNFTTCTD